MDKDLLRIVIIGIGFVLIAGMILWNIFSNKKSRYKIDFMDNRNPLDHIDKSLIIDTDNDDFDILPIGSPVVDNYSSGQADSSGIIQFSIVAKSDDGFNGEVLNVAFNSVGLEYSDMKIYRCLNDDGQVAYFVASMIEPGTFPEDDFAGFSTPGIVFFMQPNEVENKLEAFDNLVATINHLSSMLDGIEWDSNREPLTIETVQSIRDRFE